MFFCRHTEKAKVVYPLGLFPVLSRNHYFHCILSKKTISMCSLLVTQQWWCVRAHQVFGPRRALAGREVFSRRDFRHKSNKFDSLAYATTFTTKTNLIPTFSLRVTFDIDRLHWLLFISQIHQPPSLSRTRLALHQPSSALASFAPVLLRFAEETLKVEGNPNRERHSKEFCCEKVGGRLVPQSWISSRLSRLKTAKKQEWAERQFWFETKVSSRPQQIPCRTSSSICCGNPRPQIAELGNYCSRFIPLSPTFISHLSDCATAMSDLCNDIVSIVFSLNMAAMFQNVWMGNRWDVSRGIWMFWGNKKENVIKERRSQ